MIRNKWLVLFSLVGSMAMIMLDQSIVNVALPSIQRYMMASDHEVHWIVNAYLLALSAFLLGSGRMADLYGPRRVFLSSLIVFTGASWLCAVAAGPIQLIIGRAMQGLGAALLLPPVMPLLYKIFPVDQRGDSVGAMIGMSGLFICIGPFLGGWITQTWGWDRIFWINIPIGIISFLGAYTCLPADESLDFKEGFDVWGMVSSVLGLGGIVSGIMQAQIWGLWSLPTLSLFLLGILGLFCFLFIERKNSEPLLDFSIFEEQTFLGANLALFCAHFLLMSGVFMAFFFQEVLAYPPMLAGLMTLPAIFPLVVLAPLTGVMTRKWGLRTVSILAMLMQTIGLVYLSLSFDQKNYLSVLPGYILFGCGMPLILVPSQVSAVNIVRPNLRGAASAVLTLVRQMGATVGMAVIAFLLVLTESQSANRELISKNELFVSALKTTFMFLSIVGAVGVFFIWYFMNDERSYEEKEEKLGKGIS